jgi:hypothetical protein
VIRSWLLTAAIALPCLGFTGFVAVLVTGHAPPELTEKVRQGIRDNVNRVLQLLPGHHRSPGGAE